MKEAPRTGITAFLQLSTASDKHCQQEGPNGCGHSSACRVSCSVNWWSGRGVHREVFVVDVCNYVLSTSKGLLARRLDLILRELEAKRPFVSQFEGVGERDSVHAGPVPGRARVGVCRMQIYIIFGRYFLLCGFFGVWLKTT